MKNNFLKFGLMAFFALFYTLPLVAQGTGGGVGDEDEDPAAPINHWLLFLILAGVALGIYFIMKYNKKAIA